MMVNRQLIIILPFLLASCIHVCADNYAVVVDAGSTGSRSFVYQYSRNETTGARKVQATPRMKVVPGLSSFGTHPEDVVKYLAPLLYDAADVIDPRYHSKTKVFIRATAGMRLIPEDQQELIWETLIHGISTDKNIKFNITANDFGTIDGFYEAYYAVLASNYIAGRIDGDLRRVKGKNMVGAMDMGGSSTQLIFYNGTDDEEGAMTAEHFWSHSWLSFGVNTVKDKLWDSIVQKYLSTFGENKHEVFQIPNPCSFEGHVEDYGEGLQLIGTGSSQRCVELIKELLWPFVTCEPGKPCAVDGVQHPPVKHDFYGMSVYFFAFDCLRHFLGEQSMPSWPNPPLSEMKAAAHTFCALQWHSVNGTFMNNKHQYTRSYQLGQRCVEVLYIVTLIENGFGFAEESRGITLALEVEGTEVEWTLGYALSEVSFHEDGLCENINTEKDKLCSFHLEKNSAERRGGNMDKIVASVTDRIGKLFRFFKRTN